MDIVAANIHEPESGVHIREEDALCEFNTCQSGSMAVMAIRFNTQMQQSQGLCTPCQKQWLILIIGLMDGSVYGLPLTVFYLG